MAGYATDLSAQEWEIIQPYFPRAKKRGRKRVHAMKDIVNGIMYAVKAGCAWNLLPNDLPPKSTVYGYFRQWRNSGLWEDINNNLRPKLPEQAGRKGDPTAAIVDSQSVKSADQAGAKGYDGGKKVKGRKRHIMVDVLGLLIVTCVTAASLGDRKGAKILFDKSKPMLPNLN